MPTPALATTPLGSVGAEVLGIDVLRLQEDNTFPAACMQALETHGVLVFRELGIDDETQSAFTKKLDDIGKVEPADAPPIYIVSLDPTKSRTAAYTPGTFHWHIDGAQDLVPTKATVLSAHTIAVGGGETEFASTYAAYDQLSTREKGLCKGLRVIHSFEASQRLVNPDPSPDELAQWRSKPDREHPMVWQHQSGRRSLVIGVSASHVVGMSASRSRALLDELLERATRPDRIYRHEWAIGDLVIWDNTGVMHRACPYDAFSPREMHRTTMSGDEPIR